MAKFKPNSEILDGIYTFNVIWESSGTMGFYFRTYNDRNYYLMKID